MSTLTLAQSTWTYTCKFCEVIRNAFYVAFVGLIAFGESAGRARAASELSRQGYHAEAKALMLDHPWRDEK
jgi:hypothetical protein